MLATMAISATEIHPNSHVIYELNLYNYTSDGTLSAAEQKLPELKSLGVDVVWLMPIHPRSVSNRIGALGSPYAPADYTAVNPDFGTLEDLQSYVNASHELGIQVWLDWVPNHTGTDNVWVTTHPEFYQKRNGAIVHPNNYADVYQLDYTNGAMQDAMIDAMKFWIDNADVDGFRCDYVSSSAIPTAFFTKANAALKSYNADKTITLLGEADMNNMDALRATGWDYDYAWGFQSKLKDFGNAATANSKLKPILQSLTDNNKYSSVSRMVYLTNHDQNYDYNMNDAYGANVYAMTTIMMTLYGMPCIYNGQENGHLLNDKQDYFNRDVIDWSKTDAKMTNTISVLARLRHSTAALADDDATRVGGVEYLTCDKATCLAYQRKSGNETVLVVVNLSNNAITPTVSGIEAGEWQCVAMSSTIANAPQPETVTFQSSQTIAIEGKGYAVYAKNVELQSDGIESVQISHNETENAIFNLSGQRVSNAGHGIYIINGRKVLR